MQVEALPPLFSGGGAARAKADKVTFSVWQWQREVASLDMQPQEPSSSPSGTGRLLGAGLATATPLRLPGRRQWQLQQGAAALAQLSLAEIAGGDRVQMLQEGEDQPFPGFSGRPAPPTHRRLRASLSLPAAAVPDAPEDVVAELAIKEDEDGGCDRIPHWLSTALMRHRPRLRLSTNLKKLLCGAIAGGVSRTAIAPLETIRILLMVGSTGKSNVADVFSHVMATEGWTGLFRGNGVNVLRVAPNKGIELFAYERTKNFLTPKEGQRSRFPLPVAPLAGSVAGMTSTIVTYPLELIKTRLTVQPGEYKGLLDAWARIVKEEGFLELYRGLFPSMIGVIPYAGVNYYAYDSLRNLYKKVLKTDKVDSFSTLCMGSAAGAIASTATFPLEVARKQMQVGALQGRVVYKSTLDALACISREQGLQGLYRGLGPSCLKLMPAAGIFFMCYEALKAVALEEETQKAAAVAATAGAGKQAPVIGNKRQADARVLQPALVAAK